jgi:hypothetical protein
MAAVLQLVTVVAALLQTASHGHGGTAGDVVAVAPPAAQDLRVEYAPSPRAVAARRPRFSWTLRHPQRGAMQTRYRIRVTTVTGSRGGVGSAPVLLWDSGVVVANTTLGVRCGADLASDAEYTLSVAWADHAGAWAPPAHSSFATALLHSSDWAGTQWLTLPNLGNGTVLDPRNQFRGTFALPTGAEVQRGTCFVAGLGYHRSSLNGGMLGHPDDTLGEITQFQRRIPYDTFDVTTQLRPGNNTLAVLLGRGVYALSRDPYTAVLGYAMAGLGARAVRALCRVSLVGGDAAVVRFGTGLQSIWRHAAGELVADHLYFGETIDKRLATVGWRLLGFDDGNWSLATAAKPPQPPPTPLKCSKGQHVDTVDPGGTIWANHPYNDNGLCSCREYCASDWAGDLKRLRPHWSGATSPDPPQSSSCRCVQATHWCPRTAVQCARTPESEVAFLGCPAGKTIDSITFASFGVADGDCSRGLKEGSCSAPNSTQVVSALCRGKNSCHVEALSTAFGGDPCSGRSKFLSVMVHCTGDPPPAAPTPAPNPEPPPTKPTCHDICANASGAPSPRDFCVPDRVGPPSPPGPGQLEWEPIGEMVSLQIPPIRRHEPRSPVAIHRLPTSPGSFVLDFQNNQAMQCTLRIETDGSHSGTTLRLQTAEVMDSSGELLLGGDTINGAREKTTFILSGAAGVQEFDMRFSYFGARFVGIVGWPEDSEPTEDSMTCFFVHTSLPRHSSIHFSSEGSDSATILNGIHDMVVRSALSNFMSMPTDCPSREKRGWSGDAQSAAETLMYNFDMSVAYPKWLADLADAQQCNFHGNHSCPDSDPWCRTAGDKSTVPLIAPFIYGSAIDACEAASDPSWGGVYIALVDWVYSYHANGEILEQHYGNGVAYLDHLATYVNTSAGGSGLLDLSYANNCCGDWCAPIPAGTALTPHSTARHVSNLINGFMWIKQLRILASAATTLGKTADAAKWTALATNAAASYNRLYFSETEGLYKDIECLPGQQRTLLHPCHRTGTGNDGDGQVTAQTVQALALFLDLPATQADRKRVGDALAHDVTNGTFPGRMVAGLVGTKYVLSELAATGHADVALKAATSMEYPSFGRMLQSSVHPLGQGEGALWESFSGGANVDHGSRNHIMFGGFDGPYFFGNLAGIRNFGKAWDRVLIAPTPSGDLTGTEATVGTVRGDITVAWATGRTVCGEGHESVGISFQPAVLNCSDRGGVIEAIVFANYGTTTGSCHSYAANCTGDDSRAVVEKACLGKASCVVNASKDEFAHGREPYDPCPGIPKTLVIEAQCSALFSLQVSLPVGVEAGTVRLPLGGHAASSVKVLESGTPIWAAGRHNPGAAAVRSVVPWSRLAGSGLEIEVGSGTYSFIAELDAAGARAAAGGPPVRAPTETIASSAERRLL